jgi:outer membrane protein assembly factor BamB
MESTPELLYVASGKTVAALDRFTGRPVWQVKLPRLLGGNISLLLPQGAELYVGRGGYVYCMDRFSGRVLWERGLTGSGLVLMATVGSDPAAQQAASAGMAAMQAQQAAAVAATIAASAAARHSGQREYS